MDFEIPSMHIEEGSPEGRLIVEIVRHQHVSPEEAVRFVLRQRAQKTPGQEMLGAFSSPEDAAILEEAMKFVRENRQHYDKVRELDL